MANTLTDGDKVLLSLVNKNKFERGDVVIFDLNNATFVKRCIGLPGDTISLLNWRAVVNSQLIDVPTAIITNSNVTPFLNLDSMSYRKEMDFDISVFQEYQHYWSLKNFGPFIVPRKGFKISLTIDNIKLYRKVIEQEISPKILNEMIFTNVKQYSFKNDYYFVLGDNRSRSSDSRNLGVIKADQIHGKVKMILYSSKNIINSHAFFKIIN